MRNKISAAIFDMDGVLIDSEPLWHEAANEAFGPLGFQLDHHSYSASIGLRTKEFVAYWLGRQKADITKSPVIEQEINMLVIEKILQKGMSMPGVVPILEMLKIRGYKIGLASSSPSALINVVLDKLGIRSFFSTFASAESLVYGKPHPEVYLNCAQALDVNPNQCVCFEDSFNGLIAAKAARMTCVAIPAPEFRHQPRFQAADLILNSLEEFDLDKLGIEALRH